MNPDQAMNSLYNSKKKSKQPFVFPKIAKLEATPPENKVFVRGASRKYNQQNIFKLEDEKRQKVKLRIQEEKIKEFKNKESDELETKIAEMTRRHQEELQSIDESEKRICLEIQGAKKEQYQIKLNLWELKNEIMDLNAIYLEEEAELIRLEKEMNMQEEQEGQYNEQYEGSQEEGELCEVNPQNQNQEEGLEMEEFESGDSDIRSYQDRHHLQLNSYQCLGNHKENQSYK